MDLDTRWQRNFDAAQKRLKLKERAIAYMGGKCQICGYGRCPAALEFHHSDPSEKDFVISRSVSWKKIQQEILKTTLVCSNCHREIHAGWHPKHLVLDSYVLAPHYEELVDLPSTVPLGVDVSSSPDLVNTEALVEIPYQRSV